MCVARITDPYHASSTSGFARTERSKIEERSYPQAYVSVGKEEAGICTAVLYVVVRVRHCRIAELADSTDYCESGKKRKRSRLQSGECFGRGPPAKTRAPDQEP